MSRLVAALILLVGCAPASGAASSERVPTVAGVPAEFAVETVPEAVPGVALLAPAGDFLAARQSSLGARRSHAPVVGLGAERARILLRSLTVPGWGQATLGLHTSAKVFTLIETGIWASFVAFRVQEVQRRESAEVEARLFAGIDLAGRDEEFQRIVGIYPSSDDYNLYVVRRDAANLYYDDPVRYRAYIAEHELKGSNAWAWDGAESFQDYQDLRKTIRRAALRANSMLGLAIANRLVSAFHAARRAGAPPPKHSWNLECGPRSGDPTAMGVGLRVRF